MKRIFVTLFFSALIKINFSQVALINTIDSIYLFDPKNGSCTLVKGGSYCNQGVGGTIFSTALHKDILYFISMDRLYQMKLGDPSGCKVITTFLNTSINSLVASADGIIYAADLSGILYRYNPYTNLKENLGQMNAIPAGDLIFYKGKLLMSAIDHNIYEININDPAASTIFMNTSFYNFFGLISVPYNCTTNKYYGLSLSDGVNTEVVEVDMENKKVIGVTCVLPITMYDAASNADDGTTLGVTIDSIKFQPACGNDSLINITVKASSISSSPLTYILDNALTNGTGVFTRIREGLHSIRVRNESGCYKDSLVTFSHALSPNIKINTVNPLSCDKQDGQIDISARSGYPPIKYSINGGNFQDSPIFTGLGAGRYNIRIMDATGCGKDTSAYLSYRVLPSFFSSFSIQPTTCNSKTGSLAINLSPQTDPSDVLVSIDSGPHVPTLNLSGLDSGVHLISLYYENNCEFDTTVRIPVVVDDAPNITINISEQLCLSDNGTIVLRINGTNDPYLAELNNRGFSANYSFTNLAPGPYSIKVKDKYGCLFDTIASIRQYIVAPYTISIDTIEPSCLQTNSGRITAAVSGEQAPYSVELNNSVYANGQAIKNLSAGTYSIIVLNRDNCPLDTIGVRLSFKYSPECDRLFVPGAFTPNNDGLNDLFSPHAGEGIIDFNLSIYNRWGQLVFSTKDKAKGWDGKLSGVSQPVGVYVWTISYKTMWDTSKKLVKGIVTLIR